MADTLTIREFGMLRDAVFQRSADARTEREEDRWLGLDAKLQRLSQQIERISARIDAMPDYPDVEIGRAP